MLYQVGQLDPWAHGPGHPVLCNAISAGHAVGDAPRLFHGIEYVADYKTCFADSKITLFVWCNHIVDPVTTCCQHDMTPTPQHLNVNIQHTVLKQSYLADVATQRWDACTHADMRHTVAPTFEPM